MKNKKSSLPKKANHFFRILGPGIVTGAADDDPSGIVTYSQTGAQFGFKQLWTALFMLPFLIVIQETCSRISLVTKKGLAAAIRSNYSSKILYLTVILVLIANTFNIGADIGAIVLSFRLFFPLNFILGVVAVTLMILILEIFISYKKYANILKLTTLVLLAYPATLLIIKVPWLEILRATFIPHIEFNFSFLFIIVGVLGTTITPYLFFWESSQETEEEKEVGITEENKKRVTKSIMKDMRIDNTVGMIYSEIVTWCIILVSATVLNRNGITNINTASDAAAALQPLVHGFANAGIISKTIFAIGIIGSGLLAVPILAGSTSYALSEAAKWNEGLSLKLSEAKRFYGVIIIVMILGMLINFLGFNAMKSLIFAAVLNGLAAPPLIFMIIKVSNNKNIMKSYKNGFWTNAILWTAFIGMSAAGISAIVSLF